MQNCNDYKIDQNILLCVSIFLSKALLTLEHLATTMIYVVNYPLHIDIINPTSPHYITCHVTSYWLVEMEKLLWHLQLILRLALHSHKTEFTKWLPLELVKAKVAERIHCLLTALSLDGKKKPKPINNAVTHFFSIMIWFWNKINKKTITNIKLIPYL